jgi:hypothetical protein
MFPLDVIAKGIKLNPRTTRRLFAGVILVACVALVGQLVKDTTTAIIGGVLMVLASVVLIGVSAISAQQIGSTAIWFARIVSFLFIAISGTLFTAWAANFPKPLPCLINPYNVCGPGIAETTIKTTDASTISTPPIIAVVVSLTS